MNVVCMNGHPTNRPYWVKKKEIDIQLSLHESKLYYLCKNGNAPLQGLALCGELHQF